MQSHWQGIVDSAISHNSRDAYLCGQQRDICHAIPEYQENSPECTAHYSGCQRALRHLHKMMFNQSPEQTEPQVCNNFARKSIRGFFHDFMSNGENYPPFRCPAVLLSNGLGPGIDGSILSEHDISINFGLCRWAQYVNVLSDATTCDPGSVIAMAGMLGYEACGVPIWVQDVAVKPFRSPRPRVHLRPKPG